MTAVNAKRKLFCCSLQNNKLVGMSYEWKRLTLKDERLNSLTAHSIPLW